MALTFTPGGAADDALTTLETFQGYCGAHGHSLTDHDDSQQELAIRRATIWVEGLGARTERLATRWPGKKSSASQRRVWPRLGAVDVDGQSISSETVPIAVQDAVCEAAAFILANPDALEKSVNASQIVVSEKLGPMSQTFAKPEKLQDARLMLTTVEDLLSGIFVVENSGPNLWMGSVGPKG